MFCPNAQNLFSYPHKRAWRGLSKLSLSPLQGLFCKVGNCGNQEKHVDEIKERANRLHGKTYIHPSCQIQIPNAFRVNCPNMSHVTQRKFAVNSKVTDTLYFRNHVITFPSESSTLNFNTLGNKWNNCSRVDRRIPNFLWNRRRIPW